MVLNSELHKSHVSFSYSVTLIQTQAVTFGPPDTELADLGAWVSKQVIRGTAAAVTHWEAGVQGKCAYHNPVQSPSFVNGQKGYFGRRGEIGAWKLWVLIALSSLEKALANLFPFLLNLCSFCLPLGPANLGQNTTALDNSTVEMRTLRVACLFVCFLPLIHCCSSK